MVTGYLTLTVFGPVFSLLENGIFSAVKMLIAIPGGIGAALCGALYAPTVVGGIHHMYNALEAGLLSSDGINIWMPIATAANVAQGAAALAFSIKTTDKKQKSVAFPASLSAFLGITEPAIFGVNMRFIKPFIAGCIGGAAGGLIAGLLNVSATAYGITGVFGILITTNNLVQYLVVMAVAFAVSFICTMFLYKNNTANTQEETISAGTEKEQEETNNTETATGTENIILSPLSGTAVALKDVPDETFAAGILGNGAAIEPDTGKVIAPADAEVTTLFDTKHAIGLTLKDGTELLIHIGINTVELGGAGFTAHVGEGSIVKRGDTLVTFDKEFIKSKGYPVITPVVITNSDEFKEIKLIADGNVNALSKLLELKKEG